MQISKYHTPVMLEESITHLCINPKGYYVDLTFGGGGHTRAILNQLSEGKVWAFDQDPDAIAQAQAINDPRLYFVQGNFRFFKAFLHAYHVTQVAGIIADLGVSSHQLDSKTRGFAARINSPLDMRMHQQEGLTAAKLLNTYNEKQLAKVFSHYGDLQNAQKLAQQLVKARYQAPLNTTKQLLRAIQFCLPPRKKYQYYAKVFQALRIAVNDELGALEEMLCQIPSVLAPKGRLVIITYHSGEDRPVKHFIKTGNLEGNIQHDVYGNVIRPLDPVHRKVLRPKSVEIAQNNRARSARMRVAQKRK